MKHIGRFILLLLTITLVLPPASVFADPAICSSGYITAGTYSECCAPGSDPVNYYACNDYVKTQTCSSVTANNYAKCCSTSTYPFNKQKCDAQRSFAGTAARYNPSVSFGGGSVQVAGVSSTVLSCAGFDNVLNSALNKVESKVNEALQRLSELKPFGIGLGFLKPSGPQPVKDAGLQKKEGCLDKLAYLLAGQALAQITQKTLNWVNKGFGGNALYTRDLGSYMRTLRDQEINAYIYRTTDRNYLFGPFVRSVVTQQVSGLSDGYIDRVSGSRNYPYFYNGQYCPQDYSALFDKEYAACIASTAASRSTQSVMAEQCRTTLKQKYDLLTQNTCLTQNGKNYNDFMKNFSSGGWGSLLDSRNNPISAVFEATDSLTGNINSIQQQQTQELARNNGFLDMRRCLEFAGNQTGLTSGNAGASTNPAEQTCVRFETTTPGYLIAQQVANITNSPVRRIEQADELNEAIGAFFDSLLNSLFSKGLSSLQGGDISGIGIGTGPGANVVIGTGGDVLSSGDTDLFDFQNANAGLLAGITIDISRPQNVRAILQAQHDYRNHARDTVVVLNRIAPAAGKLDYCLPGPNPSWQSGLSENFQTLLGNMSYAGSGDTSGQNSTLRGDGLSFFGVSLMDKITTVATPIRARSYNVNGSPSESDIRNFLSDTYTQITSEFNVKYSRSALMDAFEATATSASDKAFARASIDSAYTEAGKLAGYGQTTANLNEQYAESLAVASDAITELESINREVLDIVKTAKARYVAERAAAGNAVDMSCIDAAYVVDESPVVGSGRLETDVPSPIIQISNDAGTYFYSNL